MIIEQTIEVPADYRIFLELPRTIPIGVKAQVQIQIPPVSTNKGIGSVISQPDEIMDIRQLLQREMSEKGTLSATAVSGDGWEAYIRERYAEP